jgi:DNA-binding Xre family transcriptional regulator
LTILLDSGVSFSSRSLLLIAEEMGQLGVWSHNVSTQKSFWSPGIHRMLGTDSATDAPSLDTFLRNTHPDDSKKLADAYELSTQGVVSEQKFRVIHPNGSLRWLTSRAEVLYAKDGSPLQIVSLVVDITDQQTLLELFRRNEKRLDALAEGFQFSTWSADKSGALISVQQWKSLGVSSSSKLLGWNWLQFIPESERAQAKADWQRAVSDGKCFMSRLKLAFDPVGEASRVLLYASPVYAEDGRILEWAGLIAKLSHASDPRPALHHQIKAAHFRGARALLDWSIEALSAKSGVSISSIRRLEGGDTASIRKPTLDAIQAALEEGGVVFLGSKTKISISLRS